VTKVYLCSFASPDLNLSVKRFFDQAKQLKFYEEIKIFGENDLSDDLKIRIKSFKYPIKSKRLFGYACWKPYIIKKYLSSLPANSVLQYSDIGSHFNINGIQRLKEYIEICEKQNLLAFQYRVPNWKNFSNFKFQQYFEYQYSKGDVWRFMKIDEKSKILNSEQIWSGSIFFKNNFFSGKIVDEWNEITMNNSLVDDSPSVSKNHSLFIEHRHDQSVFSIICKKNDVFTLSASECEWAEHNDKRTWTHLNEFPIHAKRDKKFNFVKRFLNRQYKTLKRYLKK